MDVEKRRETEESRSPVGENARTRYDYPVFVTT